MCYSHIGNGGLYIWLFPWEFLNDQYKVNPIGHWFWLPYGASTYLPIVAKKNCYVTKIRLTWVSMNHLICNHFSRKV